MTEYKISLIPGDGIGPELTEATLKVLEAAEKKFGLKLKIHHFSIKIKWNNLMIA